MRVSVIVPVYNREKTIRRCIDSILEQTYENIELIVINDGSTDDSLKIIESYGKKLKLIDQKNGGVSVARNKGIQVATGEAIIFVDSDDYIDSTFIGEMVKYYDEFDLVITGLSGFTEKGTVFRSAINLKVTTDYDILDLFSKYENFRFFSGPVRKLFKKSIIDQNKIRFNTNLSLGEDTCFVLDYLKNTSSIRFTDQSFYHCYIGANSLSRTNYDNIWEIMTTINTHYDSFLHSHQKKCHYVDTGRFYYRNVSIALNTAVVFHWSRKSFATLCEQIRQSGVLVKIKEPSNWYQKLIYNSLNRGHDNIVRMIIYCKNKIKLERF